MEDSPEPSLPLSKKEALRKLSLITWERNAEGTIVSRKKFMRPEIEDYIQSIPLETSNEIGFSPELKKTGPLKVLLEGDSVERVFEEQGVPLRIVKKIDTYEIHPLESLAAMTWEQNGNQLISQPVSTDIARNFLIPFLSDKTLAAIGLTQGKDAERFTLNARGAAIFFKEHGLNLQITGQAKYL